MASGYEVYRDSAGKQTNPTSGDVLADTGAIGAAQGMGEGGGIFAVMVIASASADAEMVVQLRNAANDANVGDTHVFYIPAAGSVEFVFPLEVEGAQRIRIAMNANLTGSAVASVFAQRVA